MPAIWIEATYSVVTPLFCAGADSKTPEVRLPSFKGVLRYWWRALAWSRCRGDLEVVRREEDRLFGSAGGGQSRVLMRWASPPEPTPIPVNEVLKVRAGGAVVGDGARYLGYGVMEAFPRTNKRTGQRTAAGQITRAGLAPFDFTVQMRGRDLNEQELTSLRDSLAALGILGGLGAKSRKGYGSLVLQECARLTGGGWPVRVRQEEGVTNHLHPESCAGRCEAAGEALTGARTGRAIEHRKNRGSGAPRLFLRSKATPTSPRW